MTLYQLYTRLEHFFTARHWRGHGVHSPAMYDFIRNVVIPTPKRELPAAIRAAYSPDQVALLPNPFATRLEKQAFRQWYAQNHVVVADLPGLIVLFFDPKRPKQYFRIRN